MSERKGFWRRLVSGITGPVTGNDFAEELLAPGRQKAKEAYEASLREAEYERERLAEEERRGHERHVMWVVTRDRNESLARPYINEVGNLIDGLAQAYFGRGQYGTSLTISGDPNTNEVARWEAGRLHLYATGGDRERIIKSLSYGGGREGRKECFTIVMRNIDNNIVFGESSRNSRDEALSELRDILKERFRRGPAWENLNYREPERGGPANR